MAGYCVVLYQFGLLTWTRKREIVSDAHIDDNRTNQKKTIEDLTDYSRPSMDTDSDQVYK